MKKVLIITYYWPPAGGPGVQRWLKFVKYLREFDIEPVVYTPENPNFPLTDPALETEVPQGVRVIKKKIFEPYGLASVFSKKTTRTISTGIITEDKNQGILQKLMLYIRGNFFIPDARKFWVKPSVKFLGNFLQEEEIDTVVTTGPPHSLHFIGLGLKKKQSLHWIADFRDPWTQIGYHSKLKLNKRSNEKHQRLEKEVLQAADKLIVTSYTTKAEFEQKTHRPVHLITNGYDNPGFVKNIPLDKKFSFSHIGSLISGRNPEVLWQVFRELIEEDRQFAKTFKLRLVGAVSEEVITSIEKFQLKKHLELRPYVKHQEALKLQRQSQVLLLLEINKKETQGIIPGKLFEYLNAGRPILALGPLDWDVEKILEETRGGVNFTYHEKVDLKKHVRVLFEAFRIGKLNCETQNIQQFSRRALTEKLATLLS